MTPTVLITGASEGIGKATALLFARHGYNLVLAARNADGLEALAQEVQSIGCAAPLTVTCDVTDSSQVNTLVQKALDISKIVTFCGKRTSESFFIQKHE